MDAIKESVEHERDADYIMKLKGDGNTEVITPECIGDVLVSISITGAPCQVIAEVDRGLKRPTLPDRFIGVVGEEDGVVQFSMPLVSTAYDRLVFRPIQQCDFEVALVVRVFVDQLRRKELVSSLTTVNLLNEEFETRGGFLFPTKWNPADFHGLGAEFVRESSRKGHNM